MFLYNSATRTKEELNPLQGNEIRLYVCGPTVYDDAHLGHARSAIAFDLLRRLLTTLGYHVIFAKNFTDIDDKIIAKAVQSGEDVTQIAQRYTQSYLDDMEKIGVQRPTIEPKATQSLDAMLALIATLIEKNKAYSLPSGDVYFSVGDDPAYGSLSGRCDDEESLARVEHTQAKKDQRDFALWKSAPEGVSFASPYGPGRPGWHLECSAMIKQHLALEGEYQIDIHGGGGDLLFPHHENETAQTRCAFDQKLARFWMHNGFVTINGDKMSKSLGNSFFLKDALQHHDGEVLRFYLLATHYRASLAYNDDDLLSTKKRLDRLYRLKKRVIGSLCSLPHPAEIQKILTPLCDDLNISSALAALDEWMTQCNDALDKTPKDKNLKSSILATITWLNDLLGIGLHDPIAYFQMGVTPTERQEIESLIQQRSDAKKNKDFARADTIRNDLASRFITLMDTPEGTVWEKNT